MICQAVRWCREEKTQFFARKKKLKDEFLKKLRGKNPKRKDKNLIKKKKQVYLPTNPPLRSEYLFENHPVLPENDSVDNRPPSIKETPKIFVVIEYSLVYVKLNFVLIMILYEK